MDTDQKNSKTDNTDIFRYYPIFKALVKRNFYGQYRSSHLGFIWQFLTPIIYIILLYWLFTTLKFNELKDYWAFLAIGIFPYTVMANCLFGGGEIIVANSDLIKKVKMPRTIIVFAYVTSQLIPFTISYLSLLVLMFVIGRPCDITAVIYSLPLTLMLTLFSTGTSLFFSSIAVYMRDIHFFLNAMNRLIFWFTPIFYSVNMMTDELGHLIWINPLTWFVVSYQEVFYFASIPTLKIMLGTVILSISVFSIGLLIFHKLEVNFAERL